MLQEFVSSYTAIRRLSDTQPILWKISLTLICLLPLLIATTRAGADAALSSIAVLFFAYSAFHRQWQWTKEPEMRTLLALWGCMIISAWASPINPLDSFETTLVWGRFIVFFAAARYWLLTDETILRFIGYMGIGILLFVAIHALGQYVMAPSIDSRLFIPFSQNANVGAFLLKIGLPFMGIALYCTNNHKPRMIFIALSLLAFLLIAMIMLSGERSTLLLMFLAMGMLLAIGFFTQPQMRRQLFLWSAGIFVLITAVSLTQPRVQYRVMYLVEQISDFWATYYGQLFIGATRLWLQNPIFGIGPKQFPEACHPEILGTTYCDLHPHNMYFDWLVSTGIIGICLLFSALFLMGKQLWRESQFAGRSGVLMAFAWAGFIVPIFPLIVTQSPFSNWSAMVYWYGIALSLSLPRLLKR